MLLKASNATGRVELATTAPLRADAGVLRLMGVNRSGDLAGQAMAHTHLTGETYDSQGALRYGEHVAKIAVAAVSTNLASLNGRSVPLMDGSALCDLVL